MAPKSLPGRPWDPLGTPLEIGISFGPLFGSILITFLPILGALGTPNFSLFWTYSPNKALAAEGFLLRLYRISLVRQDFSSLVAADLPRLA